MSSESFLALTHESTITRKIIFMVILLNPRNTVNKSTQNLGTFVHILSNLLIVEMFRIMDLIAR